MDHSVLAQDLAHRPDFYHCGAKGNLLHMLCTYLTSLICAPSPFIYENYFLCPPAFRIIRRV